MHLNIIKIIWIKKKGFNKACVTVTSMAVANLFQREVWLPTINIQCQTFIGAHFCHLHKTHDLHENIAFLEHDWL